MIRNNMIILALSTYAILILGKMAVATSHVFWKTVNIFILELLLSFFRESQIALRCLYYF